MYGMYARTVHLEEWQHAERVIEWSVENKSIPINTSCASEHNGIDQIRSQPSQFRLLYSCLVVGSSTLIIGAAVNGGRRSHVPASRYTVVFTSLHNVPRRGSAMQYLVLLKHGHVTSCVGRGG